MGEHMEMMYLNLNNYAGVKKFKSIRRAIRRGNVTPWGFILPHRPYNNRKDTIGRRLNVFKREIYARLRERDKKSKSSRGSESI